MFPVFPSEISFSISFKDLLLISIFFKLSKKFFPLTLEFLFSALRIKSPSLLIICENPSPLNDSLNKRRLKVNAGVNPTITPLFAESQGTV